MSHRMMWKAMHLLHMKGTPGLSYASLRKAGVDCQADAIDPLIRNGVLIEQRVPGTRRKEYVLSPAATHLLERCVVGNLRTVGGDIWVDEPRIFVVMPFSERWSSKVYTKMIRPAAKEAGLRCVRGDTSVRVGDLTTSIWSEILKAGAVLADISVANVNVFYELGLVHAIGKDTILIKRKNAPVPADFGGAHYYEYSLDRLKAGKKLIASALKKWSRSRKAAKVKVLK